MRFATAHKLATYGMVGCAMLAMTTGGGVSPTFMLLGLVGLAASWLIEPKPALVGAPPSNKLAMLWSAASLLFLMYSVVTALATGDFLGVGAEFLIWLTVAKACNRRALNDWQQLYLLAFLMLVAGSVLNADILYGICFLGFVICSTWALILFHLRREIAGNMLIRHAATAASQHAQIDRVLNSKRIVESRFFVGTGAVSLAVFIGAAVAFFAMPRVGTGFFGKGRTGRSMAGFSDGVQLGGHGIIKDDPTVVMRVEIDPLYGNPAAAAVHWRGVSFDFYRNGEWRRTPQAPLTKSTYENNGNVQRRTLLYDGPPIDATAIDALQTTTVKQKVYLDPLDSSVLFGASLPRVVAWAGGKQRWTNAPEHNDEVRLNHNSTIVYTVWSDIAGPSEEVLRAAPTTPLPRGYQMYLQLPPEITARTRALAQQITANASNNYDKARAIVQWLGDNLAYTREQAEPGRQEAVDFFLFTRQKGHCEYFATAFAVLARSVGIPTRNVNGFLGGEWNGFENYLAVRAGDAHSWAEVYFPTAGWVTFDATPAGAGEELGRGGGGIRARLRRFFDTLRFQWTKWVIEYDIGSQLALFKSVGRGLKDGAAQVSAAMKRSLRVAGLPVLGGIALLVALVGAWRWWRRRSKSTQRQASPTPNRKPSPQQTEAARLYADAVAQLGRHQLTRKPAQTPREFAQHVAASPLPMAQQVAPTLHELTALYNRAMWDPTATVAELAALQVLVEQLRRTTAVPPHAG
ncbi:MAG TPA: DUF3488 and transglutaminase-like domain-containing protein [Kofleriaceae bacterium]|nr:DUF3488 and transglutaminase-like domain-containing protein [Kofleriaceae bacterium]